MKKIRYILMGLIMLVVCVNDVSAEDKKYTVNSCRDDDDCVILCSYDNSEYTTVNKAFIFYTNSNSSFNVYGYQKIGDKKAKNYFEKITRSNSYMDEAVFDDLEQKGTCPTYGYIVYSSSLSSLEMYYGKKKTTNGVGTGEKTYDKIVLIREYISENYFDCDKWANEVVSGKQDATTYLNQLNESVIKNIKDKYFSKNWNSLPDFVINFYESSISQESFKTVCDHLYKGKLSNGEITIDEYQNLVTKNDEIDEKINYSDYVDRMMNQIRNETYKYKEGAVNCKDLIGAEVIGLINDIYSYVYIGVPILIIILGMLDFSKAVFESKEENMKKAKSNFIKRLIMGVAVFFIPAIINLVFGLVNEASYDGGAENYFKYLKGASCVEDVLDNN